jgi:hypothetical protein
MSAPFDELKEINSKIKNICPILWPVNFIRFIQELIPHFVHNNETLHVHIKTNFITLYFQSNDLSGQLVQRTIHSLPYMKKV